VEVTPDGGIEDYLEASAPGDVSVDDVEGYLVSINPQEVAPDDWVAWADTWDGDVDNIGHVSDVSTDNLNMLVDQDGSIEDTPTAQDKLHRVVTDTDTSEIAPGSISADDVSVSGTTEVTSSGNDGPDIADIQQGDYLSVQKGVEIKVGRVELAASSDSGSVVINPGSGEGSEAASLSEAEIRLIDDAAVVQAGSEDAPIKFQSTEADAIDPSSVSATAISSDQTAEYDFAAGQEGDWITYEDEDGDRHAGIVNKPAPSTLNVKTGHSSDPQKVLDTDSVRGVDQSAVTDIGSPAGASKTTTGSTPTPSSDFSVDGLEDNPNVDVGDVTEDDLQRGVVTEEDGSIGVLDGDTVQAFQEFMADPDQGGQDILTALSTNTTSGSGLSFPRNDWMLVRDHVAHFATEVDGITAPNANARANDLLSKIDIWKGKSYNDNGQTIERFFHGGVDLPGDFRDDGLDGDDPDDSGAAVAALMTAATQGFLRENWTDIETHDVFGRDSDKADGERSMYRGIGRTAISTLAKDWASEPTADAHTVKESKVTNWTTDSGVADSFSTDGHQLKKNSTVEDAIFSPDMMTGEKTGIDTEAEIWFTGGVSEAPPENIRVTSDGSLTMADMNTPSDMDDDQLEVTYNWANRMLQKEINLESETQIDTYRDVLERMKEAGFTHYKRQKVEELIDRSVVALKNADGPGAVTAD